MTISTEKVADTKQSSMRTTIAIFMMVICTTYMVTT